MNLVFSNNNPAKGVLKCVAIAFFCATLASCTLSLSTGSSQCQNNCALGPGINGVQVYVEPDDGEQVITNAIRGAQRSVWLEIYILSDTNVIHALEDAANNGIDVRVMLEPQPVGEGTSSITRTLDELQAAGIKAQDSDPAFPLTHEKGMIIDGKIAYIMTSNFSRSGLGGSSSSTQNREYGIIDTNTQDVQAVIAIFNADWNHTSAQFNDPNLVISPVNSRSILSSLIGSAHHTLFIETEEMDDSSIDSALVSAAQHGVTVEVIMPPFSSLSSSSTQGIATLRQGGVQVREDPRLYMHAKIIVVDGVRAFVGSENFSSQSLDQNRELGIIVADTGVLYKLQSTFQLDWNISRAT